MKIKSIFLPLIAGLLFSQCAKSPEVIPTVDYDQRAIEIVQAVSPSVVGNWTIRRVYVKAQFYNAGQKMIGLVRDTVFQDFATISIHSAPSRRSSSDLRYPNFEGTLRFRSKTYPIQFELMASPNKLHQNQGPQAHFKLDYKGPIASHPTEPEEAFLEYVSFMSDNFSLEIIPGQPGMIWRGLTRGIDRMDLEKQ